MSTRYTKEELEEYFFEALAMFNDVLESDITSENVVSNSSCIEHLKTVVLNKKAFIGGKFQ